MHFEKTFKTVVFVAMLLVLLSGNARAETFGYDGGGFTLPFWNDGNIFGSKFYLSESAELQSISVYIKFDANASVKAGVYDDDDNLVATTTIVANTSGDIPADWFVFTFPENPVLEIGNYWLVSWGDNARPQEVIEIYLETGSSATTYRIPGLWGIGWPASWSGSISWSALNYAIYGTYSATPTPPPATSTYITISSEFATNTLAYAGQLFTDLALPIILTIGLPLGFWVIVKVIEIWTGRKYKLK